MADKDSNIIKSLAYQTEAHPAGCTQEDKQGKMIGEVWKST